MNSPIKIVSILLLFALLAILPFFIPLFDDFGALQWDAREVHLANLINSSAAWNEGYLPLWSPYIFNGYPQIADLQVGAFYPPNAIIGLFSVFTQKALMWQLVFHYALAGIGMFFLVRYLTKSALAGVFSGIAYLFSGFMIGHASHVGMQNTAAWIPFCFLFVALTLERVSWRWATAAGASIGTAILAGHFQVSIFLLFAVGFYFVFYVLFRWIDTKQIPWREVMVMMLIGVVAFLISAVQLVSTYELTKQSTRAAISLELAQTESLEPGSLRGLTKANYQNVAYGTYRGPWDRTQNYVYIGITTLGLALAALLYHIRRRFWRMGAFFIVLASIALLYSFGKYGVLHQYFFLLPLFDKMRAPSNMMLLFNFSIIVLAGYGLALLSSSLPRFRLMWIFVVVVLASEVIPHALLTDLTFARRAPDTIFEEPWIIKATRDEYAKLDPLMRYRLYRVPELERNVAQVVRIDDFAGYNPLALKRQAMYEDAMVKEPKLIDLGSIKYLPCEYISSRSASLARVGQLCINDTYLPRAFVVDSWKISAGEDAVLSDMQKVDLHKTAILEEELLTPVASDARPLDANLQFAWRNNPNEMNFTIGVNKPALLFVNETWYPGWKAFIDGKEAHIYRANYLFQAVFVPEGAHNVQLRFTSPSLKQGLLLSMIGVIICVLAAVSSIWLWAKRKNRHEHVIQ